MRLEVLIDSEEPVIHNINKTKLVIGSADSSDIIINMDGVSRKHLVLMTENDQYSVTDQGSTNGTYINEERLIPGKKVEFTSFFPVRLGDCVLLSLLSDDEDSPFSSLQVPRSETTNPKMKSQSSATGSFESTKMINLKDLQQSQTTKKLQDHRKKVITERKIERTGSKKPAKEEDKKRMFGAQAIALTLVVLAVYFQFFNEEAEVEPVAAAPAEVAPVVAPQKVEVIELVNEKDLLSYDELQKISQSMKCATATEKTLCDLFFKEGPTKLSGVVETAGFINVFILEERFYSQARKELNLLSPEAVQKSSITAENWRKLAFLSFLFAIFPSDIDPAQFPTKPINYVFIHDIEGGKVNGVLTIRRENLLKLKENMNPKVFKSVKGYGMMTAEPVLKYVQIY